MRRFPSNRWAVWVLTQVVTLAVALAPVLPAGAQPGTTTTTGSVSAPPGIIRPAFLFEPEFPLNSLKEVPNWNEVEQLLDNPYAMARDTTGTPGNDQGWVSWRTTITRRPGFGVTLPQFLVHPLNYNPNIGEEMRLLNPGYPGGAFQVPATLVPRATNPASCNDAAAAVDPDIVPGGAGCFYDWQSEAITVSSGAERGIEEAEIDYNSPQKADTSACIDFTEAFPVAESSTICGLDPGEPGYAGFAVLNPSGYSVPGVPGSSKTSLGTPGRLRDPITGQPIGARNPLTGAPPPGTVALPKPSIRIPEVGGSNILPNYLYNSQGRLAARAAAAGQPASQAAAFVAPSNENDYVVGPGSTALRTLLAGYPWSIGGPGASVDGRTVAAALGKSLFWDMQVGSDGVQSCGTCHFTAGADNRTKNQVNPNHLGGDVTFQVHGGAAPNTYNLAASDFPFHKLANPQIAGDPLCADVPGGVGKLVANVGGVAGMTHPVSGDVTVCDAANVESDTNDVASSMGVVFSPFTDIPTPGGGTASGAFVQVPASPTTVQPVTPDLRTANALDPIPGFQGLRRVEPRNTPTFFGTASNFDNFWDGRARHDFNGGSVFGIGDPQSHVFVNQLSATGTGIGTLTATKQVIRFASLASLATGPGLSEFEMSFLGRNWAKIGKKLLQNGVTPLANQLVDPTDSVLGRYSNQPGNANPICGSPALQAARATGKPGLCISYEGLIKGAYHPQLWANGLVPAIPAWHLNGCYSDGRTTVPNSQLCAPGTANDPFDGYVLTPASGAAAAANTNQFRQIEGNFSVFWGLSVHLWGTITVPDDAPIDRFLEANPDFVFGLGEANEPALVPDQPTCGQIPGYTRSPGRGCFTEVGRFKRDAGLTGTALMPNGSTVTFTSVGTRGPNDPDPLLGLDLFAGSNLSLKNADFRSARCGECHLGGNLTDHNFDRTHLVSALDFVAEFSVPGNELPFEPLGRARLISGFLLASEINENGQDALERRFINQSIVPNPIDGLAYPDGVFNALGPDNLKGTADDYTGAGAAFLDNGVYNLGVTVCEGRPPEPCNDIGRGGDDAFGFPLSLATLAMKNVAGNGGAPIQLLSGTMMAGPGFEPGNVMANLDPLDPGTVFEETAQDQQINPGFESELQTPLLPPHLAPFVNNNTVGDAHPELDEAGGAPGGFYNTLTDTALLEGFVDVLGPLNPAGVINEAFNVAYQTPMGTWPTANRVVRNGSFKAASLRNVELTGPYFHNGGKLTLRQVVDFYAHGGDFPITNAADRDFNLVNLRLEMQSNLNEAEMVALVDFLLELTDDRVRFERAPFDHPEVHVPLDGRAPDNTFGRPGFLARETGNCNGIAGAGPCFLNAPAVGAAGKSAVPGFLGVERGNRNSPNCNSATGPISHYCSKTQ
jgi:cytochrome c peroxidase